jgi:hypothetical protein
LNHLGGFCVEVFDAESTRCLLGLVFIQVANRDAVDIGKFLPCWDLKTGPETATDDGNP